ncbi:MAG: ferritin-like domain-containing protein [Candidatus Sericytochromatia bacterium]|uniref:Ferritin-like domain-containing protein n=1 Tax=Candidatus Tanganyikabacteria bacterium TaxID=2961651 RepID=A0A937X4L4_9BACT|nr:ferritin-like domain-containing protein [Candidatus Tanganyikabacteria bacterium]
METTDFGRRELLKLGLTTGTLLAATGLVLPEEAWAKGAGSIIAHLNGAIDKENRAIWAYRTASGTGKLSDPVLRTALAFMNQHKEHAAALSAAVKNLKGHPAQMRAKYDLSAFNPDLNDEKGILTLALKLESDAVKAYYKALGMLGNPGLRASAAGIFADEAMHVAILRNVLGLDPVPVAFVTDPTVWSLS